MYLCHLCREYFKAHVYTIWAHGPSGTGLKDFRGLAVWATVHGCAGAALQLQVMAVDIKLPGDGNLSEPDLFEGL